MKPLTERYLQAFMSIAHRLSFQVSPANIARTGLLGVMETLGFDGGGVYLVDEENQRVNLLEFAGIDDLSYVESVRSFKVGEAIVGKVAERKKSIYVPDLSSHPAARPSTKAKKELKSFYFFPLVARDQTLGVMAVGFYTLRPLTSEDMEFLDTLGTLIGLALDRSQFLLKQQRAKMRNTTLAAIEGILSRETDLARASQAILELVRDTFGYDYLVFALKQEDSRYPILSYVGYKGEVVPKEIPVGKGVVWRAIETKTPQIVQNVREDPDFILLDEQIKAEAAFPILDESGEPIGALNIETSQEGGFQEDEIELFASLATQLSVAIRDFQHQRQRDHYFELLQEGYAKILHVINEVIEQLVPYYKGHFKRVAFYAGLLGKSYGLEEFLLMKLKEAALLHDLGSIYIPSEIFNKPGPLLPDEKKLVNEHVVFGAQLLERFPGYEKDLAPWVYHHHENWDGSGHPDGLKGEAIPLPSRILRIAETWDALTSRRSYRDAYPKARAVEVLKEEKGRSLDPDLVDLFLQHLEV